MTVFTIIIIIISGLWNNTQKWTSPNANLTEILSNNFYNLLFYF